MFNLLPSLTTEHEHVFSKHECVWFQWNPRCRVCSMFEQGSRGAEGHLGGDRDPRRTEAAANGRRSHAHQSQFRSSEFLIDLRMQTDSLWNLCDCRICWTWWSQRSRAWRSVCWSAWKHAERRWPVCVVSFRCRSIRWVTLIQDVWVTA